MTKRVALVVGSIAVLVLFVAGVRYTERVSSSLAPGRPTSGEVNPDADAVRIERIRFARNPSPVPAFELPTLDGGSIDSATWKGRVTIVNFWATWCPPCRAEIPDFVELQSKYPDELQIIGLSVDEGSADDVRQFAREHGVNYPIAMAGPEIQQQFGGIFGLPTSFVVDPEGRIVQKHTGLISPAIYETELRALAGLPVDAEIERFDDTGQVLLTNAAHATQIPGLDLSTLTVEQREAALKRLNSDTCTCGCALTLAQCRINDPTCQISLPIAQQVVEEIAEGRPAGS